MLNSGSFDDFLNSLREFESGVSEARISQNRAEIVQQVGQDRLNAFEAGELTLTDLQYSSENFLGFVGYQFGEGILIDTGYYEFDATPGVNDFTGTFTGKNGVNNLDDLKTNVQEQIILDEFQLNLDRIETGLGNAGQSLDDFIGRTVTITDVDGSEVEVELSLTGILSAAHLRGAFGTLDFLLNNNASADEIGTSIVKFLQDFGGFDAPSVAELRAGDVAPLVTDATLTIDQPFEERDGDEPVVVVEPDPVDPDPVVVVEDDTGNNNDAVDDFGGGQGAPAAVLSRVANGEGGFDVNGTDGADTAFGENGDDVIRSFGGNDAAVGFDGDDFIDVGSGNDQAFGSGGDDVVIGGAGNDILRGDNEAAGNGADVVIGGTGDDLLKGDGSGQVGADRFVFAPGDGNDTIEDFQPNVDTLDFLAFGNAAIATSQLGSDALVSIGDVTVTLRGVDADDLDAGDFLGGTFGGVAVVDVEEEVEDEVVVVEEEEDEVVVVEEDTGNNNNADDFAAGQGTPGAVLSRVANDQGGLDINGTDGTDGAALGNTGDDVIRTFGGNDAAVGFEGDDLIDVGSGDDRAFGSQGDDVLFGGAGNDILRGDNEAAGNGADVINGGTGDDLLKGDGAGQGADRFVFAPGDGNDTIEDFQLDIDTLDFSAFGNADIVTSQQGGNAVVSIGDVTVTLRGVDADDLNAGDFLGGTFGGVAVVDVEEEVEDEVVVVEDEEDEVVVVEEDAGNNNNNAGDFAAGQGTPGAVLSRVANDQGGLDINGTDGTDGAALGNTGDDVIRTFGGNDAAVGFEGDDLIDVGSGDDRAFGSQGDDVLFGGAGNDILRGDNEAAGNGADVINGGTGDDLLKGDGAGQGADRFVFAPGDGNDTIEDFQLDIDTLDFSAFGNADIVTSQQGGNAVVSIGDVTVTLRGVDADDLNAGDFLGGTFGGVAVGDVEIEEEVEDEVVVVEEEEEEDEVVVVEDEVDAGGNDAGDVIDGGGRRVVTGTDGDDVLNESNQVDAVDINGLAGNDTITGTSVAGVSDLLRGGDGNDTFFGLAGDDLIIPGLGDDLRVVGGAGSDTFFPETNGGNDIFPEFSLEDRLDGTLLDGIEAIEVSRLGNGRTLVEFVGANTTTQISGGVSPEGFVAAANDILVNFPADLDVRVKGAEVANQVDDNDVVEEEEDEVVVVEEEVEVDAGDAAADFGGGQGAPGAVLSRVANGEGGFDVNGTNGNDTAFGENGDDVIRSFDGNDAAVGFDGDDFIDVGSGNDQAFGSGGDDVVIGGAGNDILRGDNEAAGNGADVIIGGAGDDLLKGDGSGQVGADRFVFAAGDGNDIIEDFQVDVDTLDFSAFGNADIATSQQGGDALVSVGDVNVTLRGVNADDLDAGDFLGGAFGGGSVASAGFDFGSVSSGRSTAEQLAFGELDDGSTASQDEPAVIPADILEADILTPLIPDDGLVA